MNNPFDKRKYSYYVYYKASAGIEGGMTIFLEKRIDASLMQSIHDEIARTRNFDSVVIAWFSYLGRCEPPKAGPKE